MGKSFLPPGKKDETLLEGSATVLVFKIVSMAATYAFYLWVANYFGATSLGMFQLMFTWSMILAMLSRLGLDAAIVKLIPGFEASSTRNQIKPTYYSSLLLICLISGIYAGLGIWFFPEIISLLQVKDPANTWKIILFSILPLALYTFHAEIFKAYWRMTLFSIFQTGLLFALALVLLLSFTNISTSIPNYLLPQVSFFVALLIATIVVIFFSYPFINHPAKHVFTRKLSALLSYALPMLVTNAMFYLLSWTDILFLGVFTSDQEVGVYAAAVKLAQLISLGHYALNAASTARFSSLYAAQNLSALRLTARKTSRYGWRTSLPVALVLFLFAHFWLGLFGNEFVQGVTVLLILGTAQLLAAALGSVINFLNMCEQHKLARSLMIGFTLMNVVLNLIFIPLLGWQGAAWATAISQVGLYITATAFIKKRFGFWITDWR